MVIIPYVNWDLRAGAEALLAVTKNKKLVIGATLERPPCAKQRRHSGALAAAHRMDEASSRRALGGMALHNRKAGWQGSLA
jgi:hypothetical protein